MKLPLEFDNRVTAPPHESGPLKSIPISFLTEVDVKKKVNLNVIRPWIIKKSHRTRSTVLKMK